ncbi:MAG: hypothetical protein ACLFSQ_07965 [Candidatus Zixiibacteriota bacterium]
MNNLKPKPRPYKGLDKKLKHQLGALAFIGLILFLAFLPQGDFIDLVSLAPHKSIERGKTAIERMGHNPEDYKFKTIDVQKLIGIGQLTYLNRFCNLGAIDDIRKLGVPLSLYKLEYESEGQKAYVWIDPSDGRIFTYAENPMKRMRNSIEDVRSPKEAISIIKETQKAIDSLRNADSALNLSNDSLLDTLESKDSLEITETKPAEIQTKGAKNQEIREAIALGRRAIILAGIDIDKFEIADVKPEGLRYDKHLIWQSDIICEGALVQINQDLIDGMIQNMQVSIALPEYWFLQKENSWNYFRWILIGLFIIVAAVLILIRFSKSFIRYGIWDKSYGKIILMVFIIELIAAANLIPTHTNIENGAVSFVSRFMFFSLVALIAWRTLRTIVPPIVDRRRDRLLYMRDGILTGLLSAIALMGIHNFLLWIGGKSGLTIGSTFILGQRSISTIPSYSGIFPAINTIQQLFEIIITLLPIIITLFGILLLRFKRRFYFKIMVFVSIAIGTLLQGTSPELFAVLLAGNFILGIFAFYLMITYTKTNIVAYITAIMTYVLITDAYHYVRGAISTYFILNALALIVIALIPPFILIHLSFFTEIREKYDGPIE